MMRALALGAAVLLCAGTAATAQYTSNQSFSRVERGRYLATVGDCIACHTAPGGKPFAGGRKIPTPFGNLVSPNITPDMDTGIGAWSEAKFYRTMHKGVSDARLYPAMPYPYYTKTTRADVDAIRAYLRTVAPVRNPVKSDTLPFPFSIRASMAAWDAMFFTPGTWNDNPGKSAEWNRGGYLVEGLGHCGACHTPKNVLGGDKNTAHLQGYALQGWFATDITGDPRVGLGGWSVDDIMKYLKTGTNRFDSGTGLMAEEVADSTSHWSETDLRAAATYLKDQRGAAATAPKPLAANDQQMRAGLAIYADQCAACHAGNGAGVSHLFPTLKGNPGVQAARADSLLHVVLDGTRAVATSAEPTGAAMPAFGWKLSDAQVAAVTTYIRNAWGNAAPAVSEGSVRDMRGKLAMR